MKLCHDSMFGREIVADAPTDIDVVFGRGGFANLHKGNQSYLELVRKHEKEYMACKRKYQKLISLCIIHQLLSQGTRFLKKDEKSGLWKTVKLSQCRLKISQRLRERAPFIKLEQMRAASPRKDTVADANVCGITKPLVSFPPVVLIEDSSSDEERGNVTLLQDHKGDNDEDSLPPLPSYKEIGWDDKDWLEPLTGMFERIFGYDPVICTNYDQELEDESCKRHKHSILTPLSDTTSLVTEDTIPPHPHKRRKISFNSDDFSKTYFPLRSTEDHFGDYADEESVMSVLSFQMDDFDFDQEIETLDELDVSPNDEDMFQYLKVLL